VEVSNSHLVLDVRIVGLAVILLLVPCLRMESNEEGKEKKTRRVGQVNDDDDDDG